MAARRHVLLLMHNWAGYLYGVQLGTAQYFTNRPEWVWTRAMPTDDFVGIMGHGGFDGVIAYVEPWYQQALVDLRIPVVDVSNWLEERPFPRVIPDDAAIGRMAAAYLLDLGLKQFGIVGPMKASFSIVRCRTFMEAIQKRGFPAEAFRGENVAIRPQTVVPHGIGAPLAEWLLQMPKPAGIFATNDDAAAYVLEATRHLGIRVPEELCVLGVDNDELISKFTHPALSSIQVSAHKIGFEAARLLDNLMNGQPQPSDPILLPPASVVARQSTNLLTIDDPEVLAAVRFIRENIHRRLTVAHLLEVIPLNRRYLERKFKRHLGRSPLQEIQRVRLETARALLSDTDLSMPSVAKASGYHNQERLSTVFHRATGVTPTAYRRSFRLHDQAHERG